MRQARLAVFLWIAAAVLSPAADEPVVRILAPENGGVWVGQKEIRIAVENLALDKIRSLEVFLDGKLLREFKEPPFEMRHDFGLQPSQRRLKALVHALNEPLLQAEIRSAEIDDAHVIKVTHVFLPVTVTDSTGNYVPDLVKEDFAVLEEGVEQPVLSLALSEKSVLHVLLLIDISSSMKGKITQVKEGARFLLSRLILRKNKAMVVFFNRDVFHENSEFTSDIRELFNPIAAILPFGSTAMYDAINYCFRFLKPLAGRNIIVLFSDGQDNASFVDPYTLIKRAERANTQIYAIGSSFASTEDSLYHDILDSLATSSGGLTFYLKEAGEIQQVYERIQRDINATYVLEIASKDLGARKYRRIEVKLNKRGYNIRTIKGYYN